MKKIITLSNECALELYNILVEQKLERSANRNRWKFLKVIEDKVFDYEEQAKKMVTEYNKNDAETKQKTETEVSKKIKELAKQQNQFTFTDREIFSQGTTIFEKAGGDLSGIRGKLYTEIEDSFMDVQTIDK